MEVRRGELPQPHVAHRKIFSHCADLVKTGIGYEMDIVRKGRNIGGKTT
jgi:hypothetical protein